MIQKDFTVITETGIHARPATLLVGEASKFKSTIKVSYEDKSADVKSILGVMSLGITEHANITISIEGEDEEQAMESISTLLLKEEIAK